MGLPWQRSVRPLSIQTFAIAALAVIGLVTALGTSALIGTTAQLRGSIDDVIRDTTSRAIAEELERSLLTYHRLSNLYVLTGDEAVNDSRRPMEGQMDRLLARARRFVAGPAEVELLDRVSVSMKEHLRRRSELEREGLGFEEVLSETLPSLSATLTVLEELRALNAAQVERDQEAAQRVEALVTDAGYGVAGAMALLLVGMSLVVRQLIVRPIVGLHGAVRRVEGGELEARTDSRGFLEVAQLAEGFNRMAHALARQREDQLAFIAGVAHDLRNPLNGVKLGLGVVERGISGGQRRESLALLDRQVDRLGRMVDDLLDATRIEAGKLELRSEPVDVRECVDDMIALYAPTSPEHDITARMPDEPVIVVGDQMRIEQVISNLLSNAIKYSPRGGPVTVEVDTNGPEAVVAVSDEGRGISLEDQEGLFMPFRRRTSEPIPGAGLGLSVVRRIVEGHGGAIQVRSTPGKGSTFVVTFPRTRLT